MELQKVWVSDPVEGFVIGQIIDIGMDEVTVQINDRKNSKVTVSLSRTYPAEEHDNKDFDDNCKQVFVEHLTTFNFFLIFIPNCMCFLYFMINIK